MRKGTYMAVYEIYCEKNGKSYIGCSTNLHFRWYEHIKAAENGYTGNNGFWKYWKKHGSHIYHFKILEFTTSRKYLLEAEKKWIRARNPKYLCNVQHTK